MEIEQIRPHLWRWTATHPDWSPEEGGPTAAESRRSRSAPLVEADCLVLIGVQLRPSRDDEEQLYGCRLTRRPAPAARRQVLLTRCSARAQRTDAPRPLPRRLVSGCPRPQRRRRRDGARFTDSYTYKQTPLPEEIEAEEDNSSTKVLLSIPSQRAYDDHDVLLGTPARDVHVLADLCAHPGHHA